MRRLASLLRLQRDDRRLGIIVSSSSNVLDRPLITEAEREHVRVFQDNSQANWTAR